MEDYGQLTRAELISLIRELEAARGGTGGLASEKPAEFQVFSEWQQREFDRSPWPMRIFEHGTFRFLAVNDAAVKLYGYSREEFLKLTARDTRHLDEHAEFLTTLNEPTEYLRHRGARRHIRKDGEIIVVEAVTQDILFNGLKARLSMNIEVTERNRAEDELRRQKQLFEAVIDNIPARIFIRDAKTMRYVMRNRFSEEDSGHPIGSSIGKSVYDLYPGELANLFSSTDAEALKTGRLVEVPELRMTGKSGEPRIRHVRKVPVFDENGQPWMLVGISNDITERKRIEDALRESNEFLRSVIESSRDCIKVLDLDGRLLMISAGGQRLLEIEDVASLLDTSWLGFWKEADHAAASAALDAARGGGVGSFEGYCPTAKGTPRWWDVVITPILGADGAPAKLLAVTRDVTRRKQAQDMQGRLAAIVESSQDAILSRALDGTILTWNAGAERLFGYTAAEIVGRNFENIFPPERKPEIFKRQRLLLKGEALPTLETVRIAKDGRRVQISLSSAPIRDSSGKALAISTIMRDITERKHAELAVQRSAALAQLLESMARAANEAVTPEAAMAACLERICAHGGWVLGHVAFYEESRLAGMPSRSIWHVSDRDRYAEFIRLSDSHAPNQRGAFLSRVLREQVPVWVEDLNVVPGFSRRKAAVKYGLHSAFAFPIIVRGAVVAIMEVFSEEVRSQDSNTMGAAQSIASQLARIVEREWAYQANARMAAIIESSQDAIVSRRLDGTVLTWNLAAERLFGYTAAEIVGRSILEIVPPELQPSMLGRQALLEQGLAVPALETTRMAKGRRCIEVSISPAPIRNSNGEIWGISSIVRDITDRKLREQALRESEERFRQLAENIDQVFWINTPAVNNNLYVSPAYEKIWGKSRESLRQDPNSWRDAIHPDDLPRVREGVAGIARDRHLNVEYRIIRPDGTIRWIRDRSYPMKAGDGTALVCGIAEDVTDIKQAEQERLTQAETQRDALVREVHHRIKNSLQGVAGLLRQKIRKYPAATPDIEECIAQLQSVALVYGLQETRPDGLLSLTDIMNAICSSAESLLGGRVERSFERKSQRPACIAGTEAVSVAVALNELVFNALKHQPSQAGEKRARVELRETKDAAEIRIANRGRLPAGFDYPGGRATGSGLELVRTLLSPGGTVTFNGKRGEVEVILEIGPPLLAGRQQPVAR